ncbi:MerR family transcriptional regulator [Anaerovorax odorimutans]|uniref:MerR family transcriptional regulator n=1 Tax=Anaerovorax odorimutans TaxID=109327 RepID=UPI000418A6FC|nr:MerR family transcriptional regulator [Anaerovorax odorimutans]
MDLERLTIGQMAKLNNISEQTLRVYDKKKLLLPLYIDEDTGYRYYSITQSARLDMIQYMKGYGMTLQQIKEQLDSCSSDNIKEFLKLRYHSIDEEIEELYRCKKAIGRTLENYHRYESLPKDEMIFMEYTRERKIYKYKSNINIFEHDYSSYEYILRSLKKHLIGNDLSITYFCNVGTIIRKEKIMSGEFFSNEIFVFVDDDYKAIEGIEIIPAGTYISMCSNDFYQERELADKLFDYVRQKGLNIVGDYICEVISEFPVFNNEQRNMFYKIQVPIR